MLASNGLATPPCGVPRALLLPPLMRRFPSPSRFSIGAFSHSLISRSTAPSAIRRATDFINSLCGIIAIFDLDKPYVGVLHRPLSSFVYAGKGSDARTVLVDGEIVYRDGVFPRVANASRLVAEGERIGAAIVEKTGLGHRLVPTWRNVTKG